MCIRDRDNPYPKKELNPLRIPLSLMNSLAPIKQSVLNYHSENKTDSKKNQPKLNTDLDGSRLLLSAGRIAAFLQTYIS